MELATLAVGIAMAWKYKYPFLLMPIAVTLWYLSMDLSAFLSGSNLNWELRMLVSMYFGALMIVLAVWVDIRSWRQPDYAYWLYLFGVVAFWGGLSSQHSESELSKFIYFCINLLMIGFGVLLLRRVFVLFGALGCCFYLGYLAAEVFQDSWLFPIALVAIGLALIYFGAWWQKHERLITQRMRARLPHSLQALLASKEAL